MVLPTFARTAVIESLRDSTTRAKTKSDNQTMAPLAEQHRQVAQPL